jgi:hypothetical protein
MKILAAMHVSPHTVTFLQALGHDAIRISEILPSSPSDESIQRSATIWQEYVKYAGRNP